MQSKTKYNVQNPLKFSVVLLSFFIPLFIIIWTIPNTTFALSSNITNDSVHLDNSDGELYAPATDPNLGGSASLTLQSVASGVDSPVDIANAGDGRLFIVEQPGRIRIIDSGGTLLGTPFLNITSLVDDSGFEQGLLGLVFHPDYATNGYFYVNYIYDPGPGADRTRIVRYSVNSINPNLANPLSATIIIEIEQHSSNHNGGDLSFGPDGYLYIGMGDGGGGGDGGNHSQSYDELLGKMLRIDVDSTGGADCDVSGNNNYGIPVTNPFAGPDGICDEIWSGGVRNPWRFSFDRTTGDMWIADVGQGAWEEVDFQPAASAGGENWGWRCYEGDHAFNLSGCGSIFDYDFPVHEYNHSGGRCSITGGFVYRGSDLLALNGHYLFADYCSGQFWSLNGAGHTLTEFSTSGFFDNPTSFGEDVNGEMYVAGGNEIYKIVDVTLACMSETAVAILPIILNSSGDTQLNWTDNPANLGGYTIHRSLTPYFAPGGGTLEATLPAGSTTYLDTVGGIGSIANNYSYIVQSRNCDASLTANSNELGDFDFGLEPGTLLQ